MHSGAGDTIPHGLGEETGLLRKQVLKWRRDNRGGRRSQGGGSDVVTGNCCDEDSGSGTTDGVGWAGCVEIGRREKHTKKFEGMLDGLKP